MSSALWLSACALELGGLGDVSPLDGGAHSNQPGAASTPSDAGTSSDTGTSTAPGPDAGTTTAPELDAGSAPDAASAAPDASGLPETVPDGGVVPASLVDAGPGAVQPERDAGFVLKIPGFQSGEVLPEDYTCDGADNSPVFNWSGAPSTTESFAIVLTTRTEVGDSTVSWTRWLIWNVPANLSSLPGNIRDGSEPSNVPGARQASNESASSSSEGGGGGPGGGGGWDEGDWDEEGSGSGDVPFADRRYRGPCSHGFPQTFAFTLYALGEKKAPDWDQSVTTNSMLSWIESKADVLAKTSVHGAAPR